MSDVFLFFRYFLPTVLAMLGLLGFLWGMTRGVMALTHSIWSRDKKALGQAAMWFVAACMSLLFAILLWPMVATMKD